MRTENNGDYQEAFDRLYVGMQFANRRKELGLDAETVAEQAGYSITQYNLMEEGVRQISVDDYFRISDVWYDHQDSVHPLYYRKLKKAGRTIKREFFLYENRIEEVIPAAKPFFDRFPLRHVVAFILLAGPVLMYSGEILYTFGWLLGKTCRALDNLWL